MPVPLASSLSVAGDAEKLGAWLNEIVSGSGAWLVSTQTCSARSYCEHSPKSKACFVSLSRGMNASPTICSCSRCPDSSTSICWSTVCVVRPYFSSLSASAGVRSKPLPLGGAVGGENVSITSASALAPSAPIAGSTVSTSGAPSSAAWSGWTTLLTV